MEKEIWKNAVYDGVTYECYQVSNLGRVKSLTRRIKGGHNQETTGRVIEGRIMKQYLSTNGYFYVMFNKKHILVHRLIAEAFIPNPENKPEIDHIDRNPSNNNIPNLRWADRKIQNNNRDLSNMVKKYSKQILQLKDGMIIKEWGSIADANRAGYSGSEICKCCQGKKPQYKGFMWEYKE